MSEQPSPEDLDHLREALTRLGAVERLQDRLNPRDLSVLPRELQEQIAAIGPTVTALMGQIEMTIHLSLLRDVAIAALPGNPSEGGSPQPEVTAYLEEIAASLETIMIRLQQPPSPTGPTGGNTNININGTPWGGGGGFGGGSHGIPPDLSALLEKLRGTQNPGGGGESVLVGILNQGDLEALEGLKDDLRNISLDLAPVADNKTEVLRHAAQVVRIGAQLQAWITRVTKRS